MNKETPETTVEQFNDYINTQDLDGLAALMSEDHRFVDMAGNSVEGRERMIDTWRDFFAQFPDYRNNFERIEAQSELVRVVGTSTCSDERLAGPALWSAKVQGGKVTEWRVYEDTPENRRMLALGE